MKVVYTEQSLKSLEELLNFLALKNSPKKVNDIKTRILDKADSLVKFSHKGQLEEYLLRLEKGHRYILEKHTKIIYRTEGDIIYITDFFDTRQDPDKMKG